MEKPGIDKELTANLAKYRPLVKECENLVLVLLTSQLAEMFEQIEPTLLDFSEKAETNEKQRHFYDAIPLIKSNRDSVEYTFREELSSGFHHFSSGRPLPRFTKPLDPDRVDQLSIIDPVELEEQLAAERITSKAFSRYHQELYALGRRLGLIHGGLELATEEIPGGPAHIMYAFAKAARQFGFDITLLLVIFALFDKFVMRQAGSMYESYNAALIKAGIFPNLKYSVSKTPGLIHAEHGHTANDHFDPLTHPIPAEQQRRLSSAGQARQHQGQGPMSAERMASLALGEEIFESIRSIMMERRLADPAFSNHPEVNPAITGVVMTERPQIVAAINDLQPIRGNAYLPGSENGEIEIEDVEIDHELLENIRNTLAVERDRLYKDLDRNTIPMADLDTIELVGMLFEHVLNDEYLPNIVKALISHLHTPYLKIAIIDHSFLVDSEHPARKLLNQMVEAGKQWVDEDNLKLGLYYPMKALVDEILRDFVDDLSLIERLLEKLIQQTEDLTQKAKIVEERTKEAAKGRERLESSRSRAHKIVNNKIGDRELHPVVKRFINSAWLDKMILMMLRNPEIEESAEWHKVLKVIDDIIWICDTKESPENLQRFSEMVAGLKQVIEESLSSLGDYHQPDSQALFTLLDSFHSGEIPEVTEEDLKQESASHFGPVANEPEETVELNMKEKKIAQLLSNVEFGTWFELLDNNQNVRQLKLSWFSPVTKKYMFVDRSGIQAVVISANDLVKQIANRNARIINKSKRPFVDAALDTIRAVLSKTFGIQQPSL